KVERGELVTFLGPSGCGKTTTLRMIAGFEAPTEGTIRIDGRDVTHLSARRRAIGMVFQAYALFPNMAVERNIALGLRVAGRPAAEIGARVDEMLALIKLPELAGRFPHQLSGGQQQRVSLARALAPSPQILLLDEPLSALDARIRAGLREDIRALQRKQSNASMTGERLLAGEENRLVVTAAATPGQETVEVAHEALIRNWPALVDWVNRDRAIIGRATHSSATAKGPPCSNVPSSPASESVTRGRPRQEPAKRPS